MSEPLTLDAIRRLPKVVLHDHLDGGIRIDTVLELARDLGVELPTANKDDLREWIRVRAEAGSLEDYLLVDEVTTAVSRTLPALQRIAREAVDDLAADGVVYAELRWAPEVVLDAGLSLDAAITAVQSGIDEGVEGAALRGQAILIGQILCAMRGGPFAMDVARATVRHDGSGVVGFDIAGPEDGYPPSDYAEAFEYLSRHHVPVTVHAGEAAGIPSIASALRDGRALRLGHGIRIADDIVIRPGHAPALGALARWVRDREIPLEVCPTSNRQTGAARRWGIDVTTHPIDLLRRLGFAVTVSPDNRLVSDTTPSNELASLCQAFGYGLDEIQEFQLTAMRGAFQPAPIRRRLTEAITRDFAAASAASAASSATPMTQVK